MLKRAGRGHDDGGVDGTAMGELAVSCPACPRPGINIPSDWDKASREDRYAIYKHLLVPFLTFYLASFTMSFWHWMPAFG